jgi:polyisoprenoid-binding protein YceI
MRCKARIPLSVVFVLMALPYAGAAQALIETDRVVDADASTVGFTVSAKMLFTVQRHGRFDEFSGSVSYQPQRPSDTRVELTVYTGSVDTHDPDQDALLRSTDFFDTQRFPTMHFVSTSAVAVADRKLALTGDLTIRGITKRLVVPIRVIPANAGTANGPARFETEFEIDRTEFGLTGVPNWKGLNVSIGRKVRIHMAIATGTTTR